jgi:hypothetical protein
MAQSRRLLRRGKPSAAEGLADASDHRKLDHHLGFKRHLPLPWLWPSRAIAFSSSKAITGRLQPRAESTLDAVGQPR